MFIFEEEGDLGCSGNRRGFGQNFDDGDAAISGQVALAPERKNTHVRRFEANGELNTAVKKRPLIAKRSLRGIMGGPCGIRCPNSIQVALEQRRIKAVDSHSSRSEICFHAG